MARTKKSKETPKTEPPKEEKKDVRRGPKLRGPVSETDFNNLEGLLKIQCTLEEVAAWFDCDVKTIQARCEEHYGLKFSQISAIKRDAGKISLRRAQWNKAISGNVSMQIWLGKQYLQQRERIEEVRDPSDTLEGLTLESLQQEISTRENRVSKIRLKNRDPADFERQILEKVKKRAKADG